MTALFLAVTLTQATGLPIVFTTGGLLLIGAISNIPANSLAFTSFATQLLRDVIRDSSTLDMDKGQQKFEMRTNEIGVMSAYYKDRAMTLSPGDIEAIENLRSSQQALDLHLYSKRAAGAGATRVRQGTGSSTPATVTPTFFAPIQEGLDMSYVNQALRQYGSEGADKRQIIERAYTDHMNRELPQVFRNIYTRANAQFLTHLEANKWALTGTADAGTVYTTVTGDAKNIPVATPITEIIQNMQIEARQNNFLQLGAPTLLHSPTTMRIINEYLSRAGNNEVNVQQFLNWFDAIADNEIVDSVAIPADQATMYLIAKGGLAGYNRAFSWDAHPDAVNGVVSTGEDEWSNITIGGEDTMIFNNLPPVKLEVKTFRGFADNSATLPGTPDEGKIDIAQNFSFVAQFGGLKAFDSDANVSPILKYIYKNA